MRQPQIGQALNLMSVLGNNTAWETLDTAVLQQIIDDPKGSGEQFTAFLKNAGRFIIGEPSIIPIDRAVPFNPAEFIGEGWSFWRGPAGGNGLEGELEQDSRSLALAEVSLSKILLETHLKPKETLTTGEEHLNRLMAADRIRLDLGVFKTLWDNKALIPVRFKEKTNGNTTYIFFDGQTLRDPHGERYALYLFLDGDGTWDWGVRWLDFHRNVNNPSAVLAS